MTALQEEGAFVYTHDYHAVRTVQAAQPLWFVAASWLVVGTGELYAVVEWIPAAMRVQFAHLTFSLVRLFRYRAFTGGKAWGKRSISPTNFDFTWFFGFS